MKAWSFFLLRLSIGLLVFWWGLDKVLNVEHALGVSDRFYGGTLSHAGLLPILGAAQMVVSLAYILGYQRIWVDPVVTLINTGSMLGVWRSIVDPFGHFMEGTNSLFYPSLTVFAGCLVLMAARGDEVLVLDRRRGGVPRAEPEPAPTESFPE